MCVTITSNKWATVCGSIRAIIGVRSHVSNQLKTVCVAITARPYWSALQRSGIPTILTSSGSPLTSPPHKINKKNQKNDFKDLFCWKLLLLSPDLNAGRDLERFELGLSSGNAILSHFVSKLLFLKGVSYFFDVFLLKIWYSGRFETKLMLPCDRTPQKPSLWAIKSLFKWKKRYFYVKNTIFRNFWRTPIGGGTLG